jgi:hypothetical protein
MVTTPAMTPLTVYRMLGYKNQRNLRRHWVMR